MINQLRIQNYKALRDVSLELTPVHVLIGPNDSGKTSILEAFVAFCRSVDYPLTDAFEGSWKNSELVWRQDPSAAVGLGGHLSDSSGEFEYEFSCRFRLNARQVVAATERVSPPDVLGLSAVTWSTERNSTEVQSISRGNADREVHDVARRIHDALSGVQYYRWNPQFLALPVAPDSSRRFRMTRTGFGLARCLDDILGYDRKAFDRLESRFVAIFPAFNSIKLLPEPAFEMRNEDDSPMPLLDRHEGKGIYFQINGESALVPAAQISDGVLLVLAYLTILHLPEPPRVLLVEEPENGIHPKRLVDVLKVLRELVGEQERTQVLLTTHSPYVLDLFQSNEVSLCQKNSDGAVQVRRLSESGVVQKLRNVFSLGEIWTSEGDEALLEASSPKDAK